MSSDKADAAQYEQPPKKRGCLGHCARFWWVYLLVFLALVAIIVPVIILVAVPRIAQSKLDAAVLTVQGISATNTQTQNLTMSINSTITTDGSVHATVHAFEGDMYLEDAPGQPVFARLAFPETESSAFQTVNVTQFLQIQDMAAFTQFNTWLLINETLRVTIKGDTTVRVAGIARDYGVTFKKTVEMPGIQSFKGTTVQNPNISIAGFPDGSNMHAMTTIPNRSYVTFEIGNVTFTNLLNGTDIGTTFIDNVILRPGDNVYPMRAAVAQLPVLGAVQARPACESGLVAFQQRGKTVVNRGQPLPYFADSLMQSLQDVVIDIKTPLEAAGIDVQCDDVDEFAGLEDDDEIPDFDE